MANEKTSGELEVAKLKELERTLAKELDQNVRLSEVSDVRLTGSVEMNPSLEVPVAKKVQEIKPGAQTLSVAPTPVAATASMANPSPTPNKPKDGDEISLQDVDNLLNDLDEDFKKSLDLIKNEISQVEIPATGFESIAIGKDYLEGEKKEATGFVEDDFLAEPIVVQEQYSLGERFVSLARETFSLPINIAKELREQLRRLKTIPPKQVLFDIPFRILSLVKEWFLALKNFFETLVKVLLGFSAGAYIKMGLIVLFSAGLIYFIRDISRNFGPDRHVDPYLRSFKDVANKEELIPSEEVNSQDNPFKHPEYVVSISKIVANLKPINPRRDSMIALEAYIEASNQDAAVEIHEREVEVKDLMERVAEQMTFEEIDTKNGKDKFKSRIVLSLNHILNKGRAKKIFFKTLQIKK